ncbi:MAG TPA: bifunctional precorrin-2 dehydrogenase/sirohydrochlorin ferrochelatase [Chitinophagaceae bacterium]|nr:bifunctional precorrin-2 dehydrogenase/sirohydrochlorin ferrochelatase [Chitinophagaceae bacterium]
MDFFKNSDRVENSKESDVNTLFPVFLKLDQLQTLLVGAGAIGFEKLSSLLNNSPNANISIVAPDILNAIRAMVKDRSNCIIHEREFEDKDLDGKHFVICATGNKRLNEYVKNKAAKKNIIVNVADTPALCDAYLGSIVQKGNLKIAISTNGKSPTIAKRLKEQLHDMIPAEIDELLDNMQWIRNDLSGDFAAKVKRLNEITKELISEKLKDND